MHDILYYVAMTFLVVYAVLMGGAFTLALADDDMDGPIRPLLFTSVCTTLTVAVLMAVFHG